MDCKTFHQMMPFFVDEDLDQDTMEEFRSHALNCSGCQKSYDHFCSIYGSVADDIIKTTNPFLITRIMAKIDYKREQIGIKQIFSLRPAVLAAVIAVPLFVGIFMGYSFIQNTQIKKSHADSIENINAILSYASADNSEYLNFYDQE